ncbi:ABC-2 transporter permease [Lentibacillus daqui]|uniref:ABC-2 transporter permease n=1 Tax=Lentibacillus daqui TaxID=2911514 RepID=UPI0022B1D2A6|nr:ABC-2 transporter permease [Lentibacillus daqui]
MRMLVQRELEAMRISPDRKEHLVTIGFAMLMAVLFLWLLGPTFFDILAPNAITSIILFGGIGFVGMGMNASLQEDSHKRQMAFLQTLPITKSRIVHAKFLSILIACGKAFLWMAVLVSLNLIVNSNWTLIASVSVLFAVSIMLLLLAENLLRYYILGYRKWSNGIYVVSVVVWAVLFLYGFHFLLELKEQPLWILVLFIFSLVVYGFCWRISIQRIQKRGFPHEVEQPGLVKLEQKAEELKNRQM